MASSMRKMFLAKYPGYGQWNIMTNPITLQQDIWKKQDLIPRIPGCLEDLERNTSSTSHEVLFSTRAHWIDGSCSCLPEILSKEAKEKGFLITCAGRCLLVADAKSNNSCREERHLSYAVLPLQEGGVRKAMRIACDTFQDCVSQNPSILFQQPIGSDKTCPVSFLCSSGVAEFEDDAGLRYREHVIIHFFDRGMFICRMTMDLQKIGGCHWKVGMDHTYMSYCTLNEVEAALRIQGIAKNGGRWEQSVDNLHTFQGVSARAVIDFVKKFSRERHMEA